MEKYVRSKIDIFAPIDFKAIKKSIEENGPLRISKPGNPFTLTIEISKCACDREQCDKDVIRVERTVGLSSIYWTLSVERIEEFKSLDSLFYFYQALAPECSSWERQIIEGAISSTLGNSYSDVENQLCMCAACSEKIGKNEKWRLYLLTALAIQLRVRSEIVNADDEYSEEREEVFDAGYTLGRMVGEYFLKSSVEEFAEKGIAAEQAIRARTEASGKKSTEKRHNRICEMMDQMEALIAQNPAIRRFGAVSLGELAIEDASSANPELWSQGKGRNREYIDEMRADIRYRDRFLAMGLTA